MIRAETPVLFAKACELFILELTIRCNNPTTTRTGNTGNTGHATDTTPTVWWGSCVCVALSAGHGVLQKRTSDGTCTRRMCKRQWHTQKRLTFWLRLSTTRTQLHRPCAQPSRGTGSCSCGIVVLYRVFVPLLNHKSNNT